MQAYPRESQSTFVTVLAWIFIVMSGFTTIISVMQNVMVTMMFPPEVFHEPQGPGAAHIPAFAAFMMNHVQALFLLFLGVAVSMLIAAIGFLRRRNWARIVFIAVLGLGIVYTIGGVVVQQFMFASMSSMQKDAPADFNADFARMASFMRIFFAIFATGIAVLFGWLIRRLLSPSIKAEFAAHPYSRATGPGDTVA